MDDVIEFIIEFILDGIFEIAQEKGIPKWIRMIVLIIITILYLAVVALMFWIAAQVSQMIVKCLITAVGFLLIVIMGIFWYRLIKKF